ncbi:MULTISPECIES: TonB system transport protein ExbD [Novosphingobium]|uniref:Biopolymer transport protein ExbD n=1 Tax=Novosphingobium decolorationis TaxID=2698673 RepID=A0ABX8E0P8_9SPHN|nr:MULTISPECIES: TonB system transport protein ExbD [Novosphingobium]QVM82696.1 TonB system transport protein ExbD [Novosphingobium decolorationis]GAM06651.1 TonB system transport protein ExbD type-1 [Novosphingobium sp. MBES04]
MAIQLSDGGEDLPVNHDINVTPFIDVMLVLLIIFMVAAPLATVDVKVDLPSSTAAPAPKPEAPVYLTLRQSGEMRVGETVVSPAALGEAITRATSGDREQRVFLRADKNVTYEAIMDAMNVLRAAGYRHVALVGAEMGAGA